MSTTPTTVNFLDLIKFINTKHSDEVTVWAHEENVPHPIGYIIYGFMIPVFCGLGVITNLLNIFVFIRPRLYKAAVSCYYYLIAISICDLFSCILLFGSCLARTNSPKFNWVAYDAFVYVPVSGISSNTSNLLTVAVSLDRLLYTRNRTPRSTPKFCQIETTKRIVIFSTIFAILLNIPYFFIYTSNGSQINTTEFFYSAFYHNFNWVRFGILTLCCSFLIINNVVLIHIVNQWLKMRKICCPDTPAQKAKYFNQTRFILTITTIIFLFLIGEIPMFLASRKTFTTMFDKNNLAKNTLEQFQLLATFLNSLHISLNIIIYAALNPIYLNELFELLQILSCKFIGHNKRIEPAPANCIGPGEFRINSNCKDIAVNNDNSCIKSNEKLAINNNTEPNRLTPPSQLDFSSSNDNKHILWSPNYAATVGAINTTTCVIHRGILETYYMTSIPNGTGDSMIGFSEITYCDQFGYVICTCNQIGQAKARNDQTNEKLKSTSVIERIRINIEKMRKVFHK